MAKTIFHEDVMADIRNEFPYCNIYITDTDDDIRRLKMLLGDDGLITCCMGLPLDYEYVSMSIYGYQNVIYWVHARDEYCLRLVDRLLLELGYDLDEQYFEPSAAA